MKSEWQFPQWGVFVPKHDITVQELAIVLEAMGIQLREQAIPDAVKRHFVMRSEGPLDQNKSVS